MNYQGTGSALALEDGRQLAVWDHEVVSVTGGAQLATSGAIAFRRSRGAAYPLGFSVELAFDGDPGDFSCDVLVADTDSLDHYVVKATIKREDLNNAFVGRAEFTATWCRFVALQMTALANPVPVTGLVTR